MTLYIHIYQTASGKPCEEVGITYNRDDAMAWLDDWHDSMKRAGHTYECTRLIMDPISTTSLAYKQNLLVEMDDWRAEQFRNQQAERQHELAVMRGLRAAQ